MSDNVKTTLEHALHSLYTKGTHIRLATWDAEDYLTCTGPKESFFLLCDAGLDSPRYNKVTIEQRLYILYRKGVPTVYTDIKQITDNTQDWEILTYVKGCTNE
jgi:hypothetical protein